MFRGFTVAGMLTVLFFTMIAHGQDKKAKQPNSDKEFEALLKKLASDRQSKIEKLNEFVDKEGGAIAELRREILAAEKGKKKGNTDKLRKQHDAAVADYDAKLPELSLAISKATRDYNGVVEKYNQWMDKKTGPKK